MKLTNCLALMAALFVLGWTTACGVNKDPGSGAVNQPAAAPAANTTQPATPATVTDKTSTGSMATPAEAYKTAYAARQKKDVEGLKRVMSKDALDFFEMMAEAEKKTVEDELKQLMERPQAPTAETRNEKIAGDRATLEYLDDKGGWKTMDFVKEGGDWKLTIPKANSPGAEGAGTQPR